MLMPEKRLVMVTWMDASDPDEHGWMSDDEVEEFGKKEVEVISIGYLKSETKRYLTLVADCIPHGDGEFTWGRATKIPVGMITKTVDLKGVE